MANPDFKKWVKLTIAPKGNGFSLVYEDGLGNKLSDGNSYKNAKLDSFYGFITIYVPEGLDKYFKQILNADPRTHQTATDSNKIIPLAIFIEESQEFSQNFQKYLNPDYNSFIYQIFTNVLEKDSQHRFQIVNFLQHKTATLFNLPFNIRFSGRDAEKLKTSISNHSWYRHQPSVQTYGLTLKNYDPFYDPEDTDILVLQDYMSDIFFENSPQGIRTSPSLVIVLDSYPVTTLKREILYNLGIPCLHVKYRVLIDAIKFFEEFIYGIIHDFPLHESLNSSIQKSSNVQASLFASPLSNQYFRLGTALDSFNKTVKEYVKTIKPGNETEFMKKFKNYSPEIKTKIKAILKADAIVKDLFYRTDNLNVYFNHEKTGLVPLSAERDFYFKNLSHFEKIKSRLQIMVNDKIVYNALREKQERKVEVTLDKFTSLLLYQPIYKSYSLKTGDRYRINISIGQPTPNSLMVGKVPSIDPLLPDPDDEKGHELDVVIFEKDFELLSESNVQKVYLPLLGGTDPVQFELRAPVREKTAELRINIFHKNHLLQAFLMKAVIENESKYHPNAKKPPVGVTIELSTSHKFTNIDSLKDRELFIGMNDNKNGTHSFFVKKDTVAKEIRGLTQFQMKNIQKEYKDLLTKASFGPGKKEFDFNAKPGSKKTEEFYNTIREFAIFGGDLYSHIRNPNKTELWEKFKEVKNSKDKEIQIGKHNNAYSFPWSIIYDYPLPIEIGGGPKYPVCVGQKFPEGEYEQFKTKPAFGCPHNPDFNTFCIEGFWGIRHSIEQLMNDSKPGDSPLSVVIDKKSKIFYSCNVKDSYTETLHKRISANPNVFIVNSDCDLMELLWDKNSRPSALIVFGHLNTKVKLKEPKPPRIITFPKEDWKLASDIPASKWISHALLSNYNQTRDPWVEQPLPLVFLINCSSAEFNIESLNTLIGEFKFAGAAAIIGTESDITTALGQRFIEEIMDSIYDKKMQLGQAIQSFNKNLLGSGIPLAFVFSCYGNVNLEVIKN